MKVLHILKSEPDDNTITLMEILNQGADATEFKLYGEEADYEKLLDLIFEHDNVVSWW
jgi:hypothetical protein